MSQCPCGSKQCYATCCEIAHNDHHSVTTPEQLMRSRYSAHVLGLVDYVVNTYHPSCHAEEQREGIAESIDSDWAGLEVVNAEPGANNDEGYVEFKAYFNEDGAQYCMQERSRFVREDGLWFYIDGEFPEQSQPEPEIDPRLNQTVESFKIGRNDPCICGSGKKYKKCCG
ncbi:YchJ family protein [Vibrio sp. D404a]|uniref:YchJ family protein n=1 Tax=unclassified Vibrio TaxID=2614977 RepID=UPI00255634F9|nr:MULTISPECIES: YchJ family protein [unclassified Vibrio]MDK9739810.1 YchJ family protein [Vibrio sp. D404a]MDK9799138.1 YchJ family protein [Vibrio sp. D449a]